MQLAKNTSRIKIVRMTEKHLAPVLRIARENNLSFWSYTDYETELARPESICIVAESQHKEAVGFLVARPIMQEAYAELYNIAVCGAYKRSGIGRKMLEYFIKHCVMNNLTHILLEVRESNTAAQAFYLKYDFEILRTNKNFYGSPPENAYTMIKYLGR